MLHSGHLTKENATSTATSTATAAAAPCPSRACPACGSDVPKASYSNKQWRKGPAGRCLGCVGGGVPSRGLADRTNTNTNTNTGKSLASTARSLARPAVVSSSTSTPIGPGDEVVYDVDGLISGGLLGGSLRTTTSDGTAAPPPPPAVTGAPQRFSPLGPPPSRAAANAAAVAVAVATPSPTPAARYGSGATTPLSAALSSIGTPGSALSLLGLPASPPGTSRASALFGAEVSLDHIQALRAAAPPRPFLEGTAAAGDGAAAAAAEREREILAVATEALSLPCFLEEGEGEMVRGVWGGAAVRLGDTDPGRLAVVKWRLRAELARADLALAGPRAALTRIDAVLSPKAAAPASASAGSADSPAAAAEAVGTVLAEALLEAGDSDGAFAVRCAMSDPSNGEGTDVVEELGRIASIALRGDEEEEEESKEEEQQQQQQQQHDAEPAAVPAREERRVTFCQSGDAEGPEQMQEQEARAIASSSASGGPDLARNLYLAYRAAYASGKGAPGAGPVLVLAEGAARAAVLAATLGGRTLEEVDGNLAGTGGALAALDGALVNPAVGAVGGAADAVAAAVGGAVGGAVDAVGGAADAVGGAVGGAVDAVGGAVGGAVDAVGGAVGGAVEGARTPSVAQWECSGRRRGRRRGEVDAVGGAVGGAVDAVGGAVGGAVDAVGGAADAVVGAVGNAVDAVGGAAGAVKSAVLAPFGHGQ